MRRSSIITIILLVLVIVGLTVALVVTNLPEKVENNNAIEGNQKVEENNSKEEKPKEIALDSAVAEKMDALLSIWFPKDYLHLVKKAILDKNDISDENKLALAYMSADKQREEISKSEMDKLVNDVFGSCDYTPQDFDIGIGSYTYNKSEEKFVPTDGWGGGGPRSHPARGIYKIEEYNDRYEVYEKYLYIENTEQNIREEGSINSSPVWQARDCNLFSPDVLLRYVVGIKSNLKTLEDEVEGITTKDFVKSKNGGDYYEDEMKLLTKFYDQASEYKHTFMKNEDGTFYWYKSEIIK